jgi:hypothetical protein
MEALARISWILAWVKAEFMYGFGMWLTAASDVGVWEEGGRELGVR